MASSLPRSRCHLSGSSHRRFHSPCLCSHFGERRRSSTKLRLRNSILAAAAAVVYDQRPDARAESLPPPRDAHRPTRGATDGFRPPRVVSAAAVRRTLGTSSRFRRGAGAAAGGGLLLGGLLDRQQDETLDRPWLRHLVALSQVDHTRGRATCARARDGRGGAGRPCAERGAIV